MSPRPDRGDTLPPEEDDADGGPLTRTEAAVVLLMEITSVGLVVYLLAWQLLPWLLS